MGAGDAPSATIQITASYKSRETQSGLQRVAEVARSKKKLESEQSKYDALVHVLVLLLLIQNTDEIKVSFFQRKCSSSN